MAHRILSHTADTGIEATAGSLPELVHELAEGTFRLVAALDPSNAQRWVELRVESESAEDLVVDLLSELLYLGEVEDLVFCSFSVEPDPDAMAVTVRAGGVPSREVDSEGPAIKAVTYHDLVVAERDGEWYGRVYLDV